MQLKGIKNYQPVVDFKADIAEALIKSVKQQKRSRPSSDDIAQKKKKIVKPRPCSDVRYDQIGHFPKYIEAGKSKQRCKLCVKGFTRWECEMSLCLNNTNNCFKKFHCK